MVTANLEEARRAIKKGIIDNNIDLDLAKTFLYFYAKTIKSKLDSDWESYGRTIGLDKQEITPLDLVKVETVTRRVDVQVTAAAEPDDDGWMAGVVLAIYRLTKATVSEYKRQIAGRVAVQLKAIKSSAVDMTEVVDMYKGWTGDRAYIYLSCDL